MPLLWHMLNDESRQALIVYQRLYYSDFIFPSYLPLPITQLESLDEIDRIMRQKPHYGGGPHAPV